MDEAADVVFLSAFVVAISSWLCRFHRFPLLFILVPLFL